MDEWKKVRFGLCLELEVDIWLKMLHKIYYKWYIPFIRKRFEKFLMFSIDFIFICDLWSIEIYGIFCVRSKGIWRSEKRCDLDSIWSSRLMFGLKCFIRYIISDIYHLSVSESRSFWFSESIWSSYVTFDRLRYMRSCIWEVKAHVMVKEGAVSFVFGVRGWCLSWIAC